MSLLDTEWEESATSLRSTFFVLYYVVAILTTAGSVIERRVELFHTPIEKLQVQYRDLRCIALSLLLGFKLWLSPATESMRGNFEIVRLLQGLKVRNELYEIYGLCQHY